MKIHRTPEYKGMVTYTIQLNPGEFVPGEFANGITRTYKVPNGPLIHIGQADEENGSARIRGDHFTNSPEIG